MVWRPRPYAGTQIWRSSGFRFYSREFGLATTDWSCPWGDCRASVENLEKSGKLAFPPIPLRYNSFRSK